nr:unnamed protein product [Naegleria fowleri]
MNNNISSCRDSAEQTTHHHGGDPEQNSNNCSQSSESCLIQLPIEVWTHIFGFLEFDQVKRISLKISSKLAHYFLNDENELFYRLLCYFELKQDLEECLETILNRKTTNVAYYRKHRRGLLQPEQVKFKPSFESYPKSMSQLRSILKKKVEKIKNLFPELYCDMEEKIMDALKRTYCGQIEIEIENDEVYHDGLISIAQQKIDVKNFTLKRKRKSPKWKTIWTHLFENQYYRKASQYLQILANLLRTSGRRNINYRRLRIDIIRKILDALKWLTPQQRHKLMFKTYTFTPKYKYPHQPQNRNLKSGLFHSFVYHTFMMLQHHREDYQIHEFVEACSEFILYFLQESGNGAILMEQLIPNNCALILLMKIPDVKFVPTVLQILRSYTHTIRKAPDYMLFRLLTCGMKFCVNMAIIRELFQRNIITKELLSMDPPPSRKKLNIFHYAMASVNRWVYDYYDYYWYYSDVFNLIICTLDGKALPKSILDERRRVNNNSNSRNDSKRLIIQPKSKICRKLLEVLDFWTPRNEYSKTFHEQVTKFSDDSLFYWDEYVAFEKRKFGNLNDFKRRK